MTPIPDSYWVIPGRFLAGEYPGSLSPAAARAKLRQFLAAGVNHFINLTTPADQMAPYLAIAVEEASALGMTVTGEDFPIRDQGVPSAKVMSGILDAIDASLAAGRTVYVHCWGGHGRTGTVVGCYLVRRGMTGDKALAEVQRLHDTFADRKKPSPETPAQVDFVRRWRPGA